PARRSEVRRAGGEPAWPRSGVGRALAGPTMPLRLDLHHTRHIGVANAVAGVQAGVRTLDASIGATEDLVHLFERTASLPGLSSRRSSTAQPGSRSGSAGSRRAPSGEPAVSPPDASRVRSSDTAHMTSRLAPPATRDPGRGLGI